MSISSMMRDRVDIYRLQKQEGEISYGVQEQPTYFYNESPDLENVKCAVQKVNRQSAPRTDGPFEVVTEYYNLFLPKRIEIKEKDKVIYKGAEMFAGIPTTYRTHTEVELRRNDKWREIT